MIISKAFHFLFGRYFSKNFLVAAVIYNDCSVYLGPSRVLGPEDAGPSWCVRLRVE